MENILFFIMYFLLILAILNGIWQIIKIIIIEIDAINFNYTKTEKKEMFNIHVNWEFFYKLLFLASVIKIFSL